MEMSWTDILKGEVDKRVAAGASRDAAIREVGAAIGYARPSIYAALKGEYPAGTARIAAAVLNTFCDRIVCPHLATDISQGECAGYRGRPVPQSDPDEFRHWLSCQTCRMNPDGKTVDLGDAA